MLQIKPRHKLKSNKKNLVVLGFDDFDYLDVEDNEKLSKKDLHLFLEYKIVQKFNLDVDMCELFYIKNGSSKYQVYSIEKDLLSLHKGKILIPKSLAYMSLGDNYYVLLIEDDISRLMLYIDGVFILSNHISFGASDIEHSSKLDELLVFLKGIIDHICQDNTRAKDINTLYVQTIVDDNQLQTINISKIQDALSLQQVCFLEENKFYDCIEVDLFNGRMFYNVYPMLSSYILAIFVLIMATLIGYISLYIRQSSIQNDTEKLQQFYNDTSRDVKEYYILKKNLIETNNTLVQYDKDLHNLANHSRGFDLTSVLVNALRDIKNYKVYLQSFEVKSEGSDRWVYIDVLFKDRAILERYIQSSPDYIIESMGKQKDMFVYRVKAKIK